VNIACPACETVYRIDPANVPDQGVRTRCARCAAPFRIAADPAATRPGVTMPGQPAPDAPASPPDPPGPSAAPGDGQERGAATGTGSATGAEAPLATETRPPGGQPPAVPVFGPQDPQTRARRLARALISDIKVYNRDRWEQSRSAGTLRRDFRDEILKSWEEYVEQVGESMAKQSPYFRDALNDILAAGERVF
jgi:predicted Zn finger-like uncharacterized protein